MPEHMPGRMAKIVKQQMDCGGVHNIRCRWVWPCCSQYHVALPADYAVVGSIGPQITFNGSWGLAFAGVDRLEEVHLSSHVINISGWPAALTALPNLKVLHLAGPGAPGNMLPSNWSSITSLQSLWLLNMTHAQGELIQ